jgi:hypothetical protein
VFLAVQSGDSRLGLFISAHLNEAEAFASTGLTIADDFGALHGSVLGEQLLQIRAGRAIAQITYIQLAAHKKSPVDGPITRVLLSGSSTKGADRSAQTVRTAKETVRCGKYNSAHSRQTRSSNLPLGTVTHC